MAGINELARKSGVDAHVIRQIMAVINDTVRGMGEDVQIRGFGIFKMKIRKARSGRNPSTGEVIQVPEKKVMVFKAS